MTSSQDIESALQSLMRQIMAQDTSIKGLKRLSGGASQETWAFDALGNDGQQKRLILRRAPGGESLARSSAAIGLPAEAELIRAVQETPAPVPEIVHVCAPDDGLGDGFIMSRLHGETIARKILRDAAFAHARNTLTRQCGTALAHIHAVDTHALPSLPESSGIDQIKQYEDIYLGFDTPRPVFDLAIGWLRANPPQPMQSSLVHGDFRLGNLIVDENGLAGVLDWELAHIGDPREDIAWACINSWRFGVSDKRVGGFGDLADLLDAYERAGGAHISPVDIDWWEVLGSLKWGIMCMIMYEAFRTGADPSVERAAIGRRVSETEIDLINLLECAG